MAQKKTPKRAAEPSFLDALAALLKSRKLKVPAGLAAAPPAAYASQPASVVEQLANLDDSTLARQAEKIAGYARRQAERAAQAWDGSPLIAELRRRKLEEPLRPAKVVGVAFSLKRPLGEWSDAEIVQAATEWSARGRP